MRPVAISKSNRGKENHHISEGPSDKNDDVNKRAGINEVGKTKFETKNISAGIPCNKRRLMRKSSERENVNTAYMPAEHER